MRFLIAFIAVLLYPTPTPVQARDASHPHEVAQHISVEYSMPINQAVAHDILAAADWKNVTKIEMLLHDYYYEPEELVLEPGKAYILSIKNVGETRHDIAGESFFSNIVVKQIRNKSIAVNAYHIESIHVPINSEVDVWMVTRSAGTFPFICSAPDHLHEGMEGVLTIKAK